MCTALPQAVRASQGTEERLMERNVGDLLNLYNPNDPLDHAWTIP